MPSTAPEAAAVPTPVLAQVEAILRSDAGADRIALVWPDPIDPPESRARVGGTDLRFVYCASELAMRELVVSQGQAGDGERLVMLSPFDETRLGRDLSARLWGLAPRHISAWRTLLELTGAREIDPRLTRKSYRWITECLVDAYDRYRGRIGFGEVLDFESAWRALALGLLDLADPAADLDALFQWSRRATASASVAALPEAMRAHLEDWLGPRLGPFTGVVLALWRGERAGEMLSFGLVCDLIYAPGRAPDQALLHARGRLAERLLGGERLADATLAGYGRAAVAFIERALRADLEGPGIIAFAPVLSGAEQLLDALDLRPLAAESDLLPAGFRLRLDGFADALDRALATPGDPLAAMPARAALAALERHALARTRRQQVDTAALALRACAWLGTAQPEYPTLGAALADCVDNLGHLDFARSRLWSGDEHEGLGRVYGLASQRLAERRERLNERFSRHLPAIARGDRTDPIGLPVERALDELVGPLASLAPVLLLVVDGMSLAVYRQIASDLLRREWVELRPLAADAPRCLLAALPTLTRLSRCSLLAGALGEGGQVEEKRAFAGHSALRFSSRFPPRLFHKGDLQQPGSGGLAGPVREVIAGREHRVVGVVLNAVDDQLASNAQLCVDWTVDSIALLRQTLEAARESGRLVILTSDHGHVLDHDMELRPSQAQAERHKGGGEPAGPGELALAGPRVLRPGGQVTLPWSEVIRYGAKKMGYHGGGSPQEVVIPLGVFLAAGESDPVAGWGEVPRSDPPWWEVTAEPPASGSALGASPSGTPPEGPSGQAPAKKAPAKTRRRAGDAAAMGDLFAEATPPLTPPPADPDWIDRLFDSPVYQRMRARAGRVALPEAQLRRLLLALAQGGGQQMTGALAQVLEVPAIRINGLLAGTQRLLNVDGYPVLAIDRASKTVRLDIESLRVQFEL